MLIKLYIVHCSSYNKHINLVIIRLSCHFSFILAPFAIQTLIYTQASHFQLHICITLHDRLHINPHKHVVASVSHCHLLHAVAASFSHTLIQSIAEVVNCQLLLLLLYCRVLFTYFAVIAVVVVHL